ncbi:MAG: hypothetical protein HY063_11095 [Bacteroidetes bacterium]|nr:hypothetical protein [Bacteroidota bacterium]
MKHFFIVVLVNLLSGAAFSQCCSPGNPVGGTTNIGVLDKKTLRVITFYRHSYSDTYYSGDSKSDFSFVKNASFNYAGLVLGYGLLKKLTLETELGYFINKTQTYNIEPAYTNTGFGFNNTVLSLKYNLISKTEKPFEWTVGAGAKIPFSKEFQIVDNSELPRDVQPSTHAFGIVAQSFLYRGFPEKRLRLFFISRYEYNFTDTKNYMYGNVLFSSFFIAKKLGTSNWTAILQTRHEWRDYDYKDASDQNSKINSSGGNLIFISPQINYTVAQKWNLSLLADFPVYHYLNGTQLGNKFSVAVYLSRDFGGKCEVKEEEKLPD